MDTTILNYPGFQTLPKGVRRMLIVSEEFFFDQPASHRQDESGCGHVVNFAFEHSQFYNSPQRPHAELYGSLFQPPLHPVTARATAF
jgi:hypothetical protein